MARIAQPAQNLVRRALARLERGRAAADPLVVDVRDRRHVRGRRGADGDGGSRVGHGWIERWERTGGEPASRTAAPAARQAASSVHSTGPYPPPTVYST